MGASGKWIKTLVGLKPAAEKERPGGGGKARKWSRLWRTSSGGQRAASEVSETSSSAAVDALSSVVAAVVQAPPRNFRIIRQEWAAVRVQTAFRAFLARRALRALRGIVRLQALVRGRRVRKQLAVTVKCMQALVRVQARARDRRRRMSADGRDSPDMVDDRTSHADPIIEAETGWCDTQGTIDDVRSKIHMRREGAIKRERAVAYALSHQRNSNSNHSGRRPSSPAVSLKNNGANRNNHCSYLEGWMATTKPWEIRLMDQTHREQTNSRCSGSVDESKETSSKLSDATSVKVRKNNVTTRVTARPPSTTAAYSSDLLYDENSSTSTSSVTPLSSTSFFTSDRRSDCVQFGAPSYMCLTKSAKARQSASSGTRNTRGALSSIDVQSTAGSEISVASRKLNSLTLKGKLSS